MGRAVGTVTCSEAVQEMKAVRELYQGLTARLDELTHQRAQERGWDLDDLGGMTEEELRQIASELDPDEETWPMLGAMVRCPLRSRQEARYLWCHWHSSSLVLRFDESWATSRRSRESSIELPRGNNCSRQYCRRE